MLSPVAASADEAASDPLSRLHGMQQALPGRLTVKPTPSSFGRTRASAGSEMLATPSAIQAAGVTGFRLAGSLTSAGTEGTGSVAAGRQRAQRSPDLRSVRYMRWARARTRNSSAGCGMPTSNPKECGPFGLSSPGLTRVAIARPPASISSRSPWRQTLRDSLSIGTNRVPSSRRP